MPPKASVVQIITQLELGGAQEIALFIARHLDRSRFRAHLVAGPGGLLDTEASRIPDLDFETEPRLLREVRPWTDLRALASLTSRLRRIRRASSGPLIVHTHSSKAGILGRWAGRLAGAEIRVHSIHGFGFHPEQPWLVRRGFQAAEQLTARVTSAFCPVSEANRRLAEELGLLRGGKQAVVLPPGIDAEQYVPGPGDRERVRRELGIRADTPLAGMLACLKPQKCPTDFVRVAARVAARRPAAHFFIAGDGVLRPEVEAAISEAGLGGRFHLLGWRRDVPALLGAADVLVLTSLWEGLPRVCLQAMAAAKPMVANAVDGVPEAIVDGENGFLLEPHDVSGFAERLGCLLEDPDLRRRMGEIGKRRLQEFDGWAMLRRLEGLYDELLAPQPGSGR